MSDRDLLTEATEALRSATDGHRVNSGATRSRIMNGLHRRKRSGFLKTAVVLPVFALFAGGSAWASATQSWPEIWERVGEILSPVSAPEAPPNQAAPNRQKSKLKANPKERTPEPEPEPEPEENAVEESLNLEGKPSTKELPSAANTPRIPPGDRGVAKAPPRAPRPDSPELALFREAHDWHFSKQQPSRAIAAYQAYIARYPKGRLVPEAQYNIAINLTKLGQRDAAIRALKPFAAGAYGEYRKKRARQLLDALAN